jgi:hypothetical protein
MQPSFVLVEPSPLLLPAHISLLYRPSMICDDDDYDCGAIRRMNDYQRRPKYWEET